MYLASKFARFMRKTLTTPFYSSEIRCNSNRLTSLGEPVSGGRFAGALGESVQQGRLVRLDVDSEAVRHAIAEHAVLLLERAQFARDVLGEPQRPRGDGRAARARARARRARA